MQKGLIITLIIILSVIALLFTACLVFLISHNGETKFIFPHKASKNSKIVKDESYSLSEIDSIQIQVASSDVTFYEAEDDQLRICQKSNQEINEKYFYTAEVSGSKLNVKGGDSHYGFHLFAFSIPDSIYEIYLPKSYVQNLEVSSASGDMLVDTNLTLKNITLKTASGDIAMPQETKAESLAISSISGEIEIASAVAEKETNISTTSGDMKIDSLSSNDKVELSSVSGNIDIEKIVGISNVKTTSGDIRIDLFEIKGNSTMKSTSGNVNIAGMIGENYSINTHTTSGRVSTHNTPSTTENAYTLTIKTVSGDIRTNTK